MSTQTPTPEPPFDRAEAARRLGRPLSWVKEHRDEIPHIRMGRFVRYTQECLDTYLARQMVDPDPFARSGRSKAGAR